LVSVWTACCWIFSLLFLCVLSGDRNIKESCHYGDKDMNKLCENNIHIELNQSPLVFTSRLQ
jgi:hypothetical protein